MHFITLFEGKPGAKRLFAGYVDAFLQDNRLPSGWTVTRDNNIYILTHNLALNSPKDLSVQFQIVAPPTITTRIIPTEATGNSITLEAYNKNMPTQTSFTFFGMPI